VAVSVIEPPYSAFGPATDISRIDHRNLIPGAVFGLRVDGHLLDAESLTGALHDIRTCYAAVPVVLRVPDRLDSAVARLIQLAAQLHVRGVLVDDEPVGEALQRVLTAPIDLATDVVEWLSLRLPRLPPEVAELCRHIFRYAATETKVAGLLRRAGDSARTARSRLRKLDLPSPASWLQAARALNAALNLQRAQSTPIFTLAIELGYSDHSALSHQLHRVFGLRASQVRRLLGWEWLLDTWLARNTSLTLAPA